MRKFKALLAFLSLFSVTHVIAQSTCGFDNTHQYLLRNNRDYKKKIEENESAIQQRIAATKSRLDGVNTQVYKIPVVVHIVHRGEPVNTGSNISDAQIQSAITAMNQQFSGTLGSGVNANIEFVLASRDPNCNTTTGIVRVDGSAVPNFTNNGLIINGYANTNELAVKNLSRWSTTEYYNIWVVPEINNNNGGAGIQGFAYFPGASSSYDGTVLLYNATGYDPNGTIGYNLKSYTRMNTVLTHEMGHALNLYHTFEGDDANNDGAADTCPVNTSCTAQGDRVCDTDPHQRSPSTCPTGVNACTGGSLNDIVKNYMDYSSDVCQDRFTSGQVARMRTAIEIFRSSLTLSHGMNASYPVSPYTAPVAASCSPTTAALGLSNYYAGIVNVALAGKSFPSNSTRDDNGYLNKSGNCLNLIELIRGATYNFTATVWAANSEQLRAWIDYNNDGVFDNTTETIHINNAIPAHATDYVATTGTFTIPNTATLNTVLRMRVIDEVGAISSACHNPTYGQAEDYPVYITSGTLPVTLFEFKGQPQNNKVLLQWNTLSENNSVRFEVERSADGINYRKIGSVNTAGNSTSLQNYSFEDRLPLVSAFYRLKIISQQSYEYSKVVVIKSNALPSSITVLNTSVANHIDLRISHLQQRVQLQLINMNGIVVKEETRTNLNDAFRWMIDHNTLPPGIYVLRALSESQRFETKIFKH